MKEKISSVEEVGKWVKSGSTIAFTSPQVENAPMAFIREMVRQGIKDLKVVTLPGGGLNVDFLIGARAVTEYEACHCTLGFHGPAPNFQRALERGQLRMKDNT